MPLRRLANIHIDRSEAYSSHDPELHVISMSPIYCNVPHLAAVGRTPALSYAAEGKVLLYHIGPRGVVIFCRKDDIVIRRQNILHHD